MAAFVVTMLLWNTPIILPLKILVVFFHEISHGIAAFLTGATDVTITVNANQGEFASYKGTPFRFLTANAGYMGSFLWGSGLVLSSAYTKRDGLVTSILGLVLAYITFRYVHNGFGFGFGLSAAAVLFAAGRWLSHESNDWLPK